MHGVFFASGGPGNIQQAFDTQLLYPSLFHIGLVITDRPDIPAIEVAKKYNTPCYIYPFDEICGKVHETSPLRYSERREKLHNRILEDIQKYENDTGWPFDLAILAYRRMITGSLLTYFQDRMINQHPADLTILEKNPPFKRMYIGIQGLNDAIRKKETQTRTSTILVKEGMDNGEILCQGPWVKFEGDPLCPKDLIAHENKQKKESDWPCLSFALIEIAKGNYALSFTEKHLDGSRVVVYKGKNLPYGGFSIE